MSTKLYGLVALAVGAVLLGPARAQAQSQSEDEWLACMEVWESTAICGPRPPPPPPPADEPPPPADEPPPPADEPPPPADEPPPPADEPPPPPPVEEPPPPPPADEPGACASGKHLGHNVATSGNATGHRCGDGEVERQGAQSQQGQGNQGKGKAVGRR